MNRVAGSSWLRLMPGLFVIIWATGFVSAKLAMPHASPFSFLCARYIATIACFALWISWARPAWPKGSAQSAHLVISGILVHAGYLGGVWAAIKFGMSAGLTALIVSLQPIITAIWLSSRGSLVTRQQWVGLMLGLLGLSFVLSEKFGTAEVHWEPMLAAVLALVCITAGTLYQKAWVQPCDVRTANTVQMLGALFVSWPLAWLEPYHINWNADTVIALAWSVFGLSMGASSLMYLMVQRGALTRVTSLLYLVPPTTAVIAWLMFDERITLLMLAGVAIAAYAVYLVLKTPTEVSH